SGDKLLGGPQAGLILGRRDYVMRLRKNHLFRALRVDKLTYIALRGVLEVYVESRESELPVIKNIEMNTQELKKRAQRVVRGLKKIGQKSVICEIVDSIAEVGGGSLPGIPLKSVAVKVRVEGINAHQLAGRLRLADTPIIGRIEGEWVVMDMRSLLEGEEAMIVKGIRRAID
ncbi:MAG TPA: L-seryl-tRNA(Sec) selenium transferase, partial [Firmicutes bacterium]|nr:L-seryl-tRNA(Sec) selenium transferase [Bacillota bacterium]